MRPLLSLVAALLLLAILIPCVEAQLPPVPARCTQVGAVRFYWHYDCVEPELRRLANAYPDRAKVFEAGKSVNGRTMWGIEIAKFEKRQDGVPRPGFFLDSTHHGNEIQGTEGAMRMVKRLVEGYGTDADATRWVDAFDIYIVPVVNPDGNLLDQRRNARDVDLNRNYPFEWCQRATACGSAPGSEPETQGVMAFMRSKPHLDAYVSLHTGTWDYVSPRCSKTDHRERALTDDEVLYTGVFASLQNASGLGVRGASGTGESICWAYDVLEVFSILPEVANEQNMLFSVQETEQLNKAMNGLYWLLDHTGRFGAVLGVELVDAGGLAARVTNTGLGATSAWRLEYDGTVLAEDVELLPGASHAVRLPAGALEAGGTLRLAYDHLRVDPTTSDPANGRPREAFAAETVFTAEQARAVAGRGADAPAFVPLAVLVALVLALAALRRR